MKKLLRQYAAYNLWANERLCQAAAGLSEMQLDQELVSSFQSVNKTLLHIWDAQDLWMARLQGQSPTTFPSENFSGSSEALRKGLLESSRKLQAMVQLLGKEDLQEVKTYRTLKSGLYQNPVYQVLLHVVNHGTYHRGQAVTLLRQLGINRFLPLDFIYFQREKSAQS